MTNLRDSRLRSLIKGITWRIPATTTIIIIAWVTTGDISIAIEIGAIEFVLKLILYYLHERIWVAIPLGTIRKIFKPQKAS
jgi:uncharacterized membrane protein